MSVHSIIAEIEAIRERRCIVLAATHLDIELLPYLDNVLSQGTTDRQLDIVLFCRGGTPVAARRIARLLKLHSTDVTFIVPDRCESSGTILVLAANAIIVGPAAVFTAIDPILQGDDDQASGAPAGIAAQDVRLFGQMAKDWFGIDEAAAARQSFELLSQQLFPTSLTAFYRSLRLVEGICHELLVGSGAIAEPAHSKIIERLLHGFHSHDFPLDGSDLLDLGLPVIKHSQVEALLTALALDLRQLLNSRNPSAEQTWCDVALLSQEAEFYRIKNAKSHSTTWARERS